MLVVLDPMIKTGKGILKVRFAGAYKILYLKYFILITNQVFRTGLLLPDCSLDCLYLDFEGLYVRLIFLLSLVPLVVVRIEEEE